MRKPTAYLSFTLDSDALSPERVASLVRSYSYICPVEVAAGPENAVFLRVKLSGCPWFDAANAGEQAIWEDTVRPWLENKLRKLEETVQEYNNEDARSYCGSVTYRKIVIEAEGRSVEYAIVNDELRGAVEAVDQARHA